METSASAEGSTEHGRLAGPDSSYMMSREWGWLARGRAGRGEVIERGRGEARDGWFDELLPGRVELRDQVWALIAELHDGRRSVLVDGRRTTDEAASSLRTLPVMVGGSQPLDEPYADTAGEPIPAQVVEMSFRHSVNPNQREILRQDPRPRLSGLSPER